MDQQTDGQTDRQRERAGHSRVHATKKLSSESGLTKKIGFRQDTYSQIIMFCVEVHGASKESILAQNVSISFASNCSEGFSALMIV